MAFEWALSEPETVAGLVALSTWLPEELATAIGERPGQEELPVLVLHGTEDQMVDVDRARASRERLRDFGVQLMYRELTMGHEISREALRLIVRWLDEKPFAPRPA
jgi:phospholipase/carboxylesterase